MVHLSPYRGHQLPRIEGSAYIDRHSSEVPPSQIGDVSLNRNFVAQARVFHVLCNADNFHIRLGAGI